MNAERFLDTNVLVYAAAGRLGEEAKQKRALEVLNEPGIGVSAQVLQEFFVTVTRKIAEPLPAATALEWIDLISTFPTLPVDASLVKRAIWISERYRISYWDGAVVGAAEALGASVLYSDDLSHGQHYGSVEVLNPFAS